jgi:quercetin dioxygenase-like cupin family protein
MNARRRFLKQATALALTLPPAVAQAAAADTGTPAPATAKSSAAASVAPTIVRTHELMAREPNTNTKGGKVWRLHQSTTSRTNLVEMRGEAGEHIHPDAEHSLYVISGEVHVRAGSLETTLHPGDYISIPAGMKHGYTVPADKIALLISMDAPPYDPAKTTR